MPVFALKMGTAVGAVVPAGTVTGYGEMVFVGREQLPVTAVTDDTPVTVDAVVGSVSPALLVNVMDVTSRFHPFPVPVSSSGTSVRPSVLVWFVPFSVTLGHVAELGVERPRLPPLHTMANCSMSVWS